MYIHKCAVDLKEQISKKNELIDKRKKIIESIKKGRNFFLVEENKLYNDKRLSSGANRMLELIDNLTEIDKEICDLDIIMVAKIEMELGDFIARGFIPERINEAGDPINKVSVMLTPFKTDDPNMVEVTPDDIWFLKLAKQAMDVKGIEILEKPMAE